MNQRVRSILSRGVGLALLLAPLGGCASSTGPAADPLVGDWIWIRSTGGIAGVVVTPESAGYSMSMRFGEAGTIELRRDGEVTGQTTYTTESRPGAAGGPHRFVLYADPILGFSEQEYRLEALSTLVLIDGCCDGFVYEFRRVP